MTDFPSRSWPVRTLRTGRIMRGSSDRVARGDALAILLAGGGRELEVPFEALERAGHAERLRFFLRLDLFIPGDQGVFHGEHGVVVDVRIAFDEEVRDDLLVARRRD